LFSVFPFPVRKENSGFVRSSFHLRRRFWSFAKHTGAPRRGSQIVDEFCLFSIFILFLKQLSFLGYKSVIKKSGCAFEEEA
jgi:hypothetical protein